MSIGIESLRDFRAATPEQAAILGRLQHFLALHGSATLSSEIAGEIGHVTACAWVFDAQNTRVLLVWGRKENAWKLPGAHADGDLRQTAIFEATRALGRVPATQNPLVWALGEREIETYWQTPAHQHFGLIFRFDERENASKNEAENALLPRGARWFSLGDIAECGDAALIALLQKSAALSG